MKELERQAEEWLRNEDTSQHQERRRRLAWLGEQMPEPAILLFHGGWATKQLFEEAKYCFVYGQYLATISMAFGWVERTIASLFFAAGEDDGNRAPVSKLLLRARKRSWLNNLEFAALERARDIRNNVAHFRGPLHDGGYEARSVATDRHPSEIAERDATDVLEAAFNLLKRSNMKTSA